MSSFINSIMKGKKSPEQLVKGALRIASEYLQEITHPGAESKLANLQEELNKKLGLIKAVLYGEGEKLEVEEEKAVELSRFIQSEGLMLLLIEKMRIIPFEARKDTALIFNNLVRKNTLGFGDYVYHNYRNMVEPLVDGYSDPDIALSCGSMLRECLRNGSIIHTLINSEKLWLFFDVFVHQPNFDAASDAFNTLRDLLTSAHNTEVAQTFLNRNFVIVFKKYEVLLQSDNYVTRRRSLKLLGELLLDRNNFIVMMRFISDKHYLKVVMTLLRDKSPNIQFEAFHVFKVFVANPKKPPDIHSILYQNKDKLVTFLTSFQTERMDPQFVDEKKLLVDTLTALSKPVRVSSEVAADNNGSGSPRGSGSGSGSPRESRILSLINSSGSGSISPPITTAAPSAGESETEAVTSTVTAAASQSSI